MTDRPQVYRSEDGNTFIWKGGPCLPLGSLMLNDAEVESLMLLLKLSRQQAGVESAV